MALTGSRYVALLGLALLAGCDAGRMSNESQDQGSAAKPSTPANFTLVSTAFRNGDPIPKEYSCDGADRIPDLHWGEPPSGTRSFALILDDPDAPTGTFGHWGVFGIPASVRSIAAGAKVGTEVANDFGNAGYGGPCPPKGGHAHHYRFRLLALDVDRLAVNSGAKVADLEHAARGHTLAEARLVGTYDRS